MTQNGEGSLMIDFDCGPQRELLLAFRLMDTAEISKEQKANLIDRLKRRVTFIKYKLNGHTYSRIYYLVLSEDAIHYQGSAHRSKHEACKEDVGGRRLIAEEDLAFVV
jgi:hypothetical protein